MNTLYQDDLGGLESRKRFRLFGNISGEDRFRKMANYYIQTTLKDKLNPVLPSFPKYTGRGLWPNICCRKDNFENLQSQSYQTLTNNFEEADDDSNINMIETDENTVKPYLKEGKVELQQWFSIYGKNFANNNIYPEVNTDDGAYSVDYNNKTFKRKNPLFKKGSGIPNKNAFWFRLSKYYLWYTFNKKEIIFQEGKTQIIINNETITLTSVEYQMVKLLIQENNKVISREQFLDVLYKLDYEVFDRVIDVHIRNIRKKFKTVSNKEIIKTIYGLGYSFVGALDE